nr:anhydro-N-acetylmuramic acid kinase [uncultured Lichenicoccus sp.]
MSRAAWAIGLMTGTVLDGNIDIALLRSDGETIAEFGPWALAPYPDAVRALLPPTLAAARNWNFEGPEPAVFAEAEAALTRAQAQAVTEFLLEHRIAPGDIDIIGFHGQTVLHRAPADGRPGRTRQLGDGALMARLTGIDSVHDFRTADVAAGGQGAPLAPIYHVALLRAAASGEPGAVLNLGGVGNITSWDGEDGIAAFDTGPGNAPLNDWVRRHGAGGMDRDGAIAAAGHVDEARLERLLAHPWLYRPFPKSLDRDDFTAAMADGLSLADGAATLTAFTAGCVARALALLPARPARLMVCGGGRRNPSLMRELAGRTGAAIDSAEAHGWRGDAIEAECFAYLALRCRRGLAISFPGTTGVPAPLVGGVLNPA